MSGRDQAMAKTKNPELKRERKAQIIETVGRLLAEGSHGALTLDRVAKETGVSKGMVTYYFASKDQLVTEAIGTFLDAQVGLVRDIIRQDRPIKDRLTALIEMALADREILGWRLRFQVEVWSYAKDSPEVLEAVRSSYVEFRRELLAMLELNVEEGYVTVPDAQWIHLLLYSLIDGLSIQLALDPTLDLEDVRRRTLGLMEGILTSR